MAGTPPEIERLLRERNDARAARDFARADEIRDRIGALGFEIRDQAGGAVVVAKPRYETIDPGVASKPLQIARAPAHTIAIHVAYDGYRDDLERFVSSLERHCAHHDFVVAVNEAGAGDGDWLESKRSDRVVPFHFAHDPGWARRMNVAMHLPAVRARLVAIADTSVEATGDILGPVIAAFDDPTVGIAGPWGIVTDNLRDFRASSGPDVDAIEGYFLATRAELLDRAVLDDKFRWYRHADIDLSFKVRDLGFRAVVTDPRGERHTHRAWAALQPDERDKLSRKNFNRFLEHFRGRSDLMVGRRAT